VAFLDLWDQIWLVAIEHKIKKVVVLNHIYVLLMGNQIAYNNAKPYMFQNKVK
jgi:ABC-type branched-subunit amino acid transport system ATPase component